LPSSGGGGKRGKGEKGRRKLDLDHRRRKKEANAPQLRELKDDSYCNSKEKKRKDARGPSIYQSKRGGGEQEGLRDFCEKGKGTIEFTIFQRGEGEGEKKGDKNQPIEI